MKKKSGKPPRRLSVVIMFIVIIIALFLLLVNFITDWMWFKEMGYVSVFFKQLFTELKVGIPVFVILTVLINIYLKQLKKNYFKKIESNENTDLKKLNRYTMIIAVVFGALTAIYSVSKLWFQILQYANSTDFNIKDPLFNLDISFYIFKLDFLKQLNEMFIGVVLLLVAITVLYYIILITMHTPKIFEEESEGPTEYVNDDERYSGSSNPFEGFSQGNGGNPFEGTPLGKIFGSFAGKANGPRKPKPKKHLDDNNFKQLLNIASGQLAAMGVIFFLMLAVDFFLKQFDLLHAHTGAVYGAGFTDVHITLWVYRALSLLSLVGAVMVVHNIRKKKFKRIFIVPVIMIVIGVAGLGVGALVQNFIVSPDEINKEDTYLADNIKYTQYAYQLDDVDTKPFAATDNLTNKDIKNNDQTISNIRINDYIPVKTFYNQVQSIRKYYTFNGVDIDRYNINGAYTQTYLSTREINENDIQDTWLNKHIKYTHGYGLTLSKVNSVTASGQPSVMIKNIPPESTVDEIKITRPEIYFGELTNEYILVNTDEDEFDYPDGNSNKYTKYEGTAGIKMSFFNRLLFSIREGSMKMLVSSNITKDSKIIIYRNVMERIKKIMPYLSYEDDPYAVTVDGKIYWIVDAYTTSSYYPYSEPYDGEVGGTNYVRNSVKVVVDAYNGDVDYYVIDKQDPMAVTMQKIYPKLFKDIEKMPKSLQAHLRYPNTLFEIQANVYGRYHMNDVKVFYQNEDLWDIAHETYGREETVMTPNYYIIKLPGEKDAEFINTIPYTPKSKQNMTALLVARNDGENYGQLVAYQFPKNKTIYGPMQVEAQIDQTTEISQDFSLWSQAGSTYSRGNLFVIPIEDSLLYVEPVYLEASNSAIPEVKRVIAVYGDKIAYEPTLGEALISLFGGESDETSAGDGNPTGEPGKTLTQKDYIKKASDAYDKAQEALKSGDWAEYGKYMDQLEEYLNKLS